ncbi:MAG: hypothetical protein P8X89_05455 [Reinekea sp.]
MLPKNWGEPMSAPAIFENKKIKLLHSGSRIQDITLVFSSRK